MSNITLEMILIAIVLAVLGALIINGSQKKKKRKVLFEENKAKYSEAQKLFDDTGDLLNRAEEISKNDESITLFNKWYKEYNAINVELGDLTTDYNEVTASFAKGKHKDFLEMNKSVSFKIEAFNEKIKTLNTHLSNYTNYELENTKIALELKTSLKEVENSFEVNLAIKDLYTDSFNAECNKVEYELTRFEDLQKLGDYTKARKHLKNATDLIDILENNYAIINNIFKLCSDLESNMSIIDNVTNLINERNFRLDQDEHLQNYTNLIEQKKEIEHALEDVTFDERITEEYVEQKEKELASINESIYNIKTSIEEQYSKIKVIEDHIAANQILFEQSDELVEGAIEELVEIAKLYQMPENKAIQKLENEVKRYNKFKEDYEILLDLVCDLKEDYESLATRFNKSNEFLKHFITNIKNAINGLRDIRTDEIKAVENIDDYKKSITTIEFYLSNEEHLNEMSIRLKNKLEEAYIKIENLDKSLNETPLNISEVRKLMLASETLIDELKILSEEEIKAKQLSQALICFANRFVDSTSSQDILSHAMTLYNNNNYTQVIKEIKQSIYNDFENAEALYNQIVSEIKYNTITNYIEGN